jgi:hypothetical protein
MRFANARRSGKAQGKGGQQPTSSTQIDSPRFANALRSWQSLLRIMCPFGVSVLGI